jgi:AmmeMemoRadiSam system protein A
MSPSPEDSPPAGRSNVAEGTELSPEERALLLKLAHQSIASALERCEISLTAPSPRLAEPRGVFTTLYFRGELRGCVGFALPVAPLYRAVAETAQGAAFDDSRFPPVTREELADIRISLSVLSPLRPILPEEIEVGRHGLLVTQAGRRGLLLPQVPGEHGWDRITFLEQTCNKAALPLNAWQHGARIESFTAEVFGDRDKT